MVALRAFNQRIPVGFSVDLDGRRRGGSRDLSREIEGECDAVDRERQRAAASADARGRRFVDRQIERARAVHRGASDADVSEETFKRRERDERLEIVHTAGSAVVVACQKFARTGPDAGGVDGEVRVRMRSGGEAQQASPLR